MRSVVVFPHPDGPSRLVNVPDGISRFMRSTATTDPKRLVTAIIVTSGVASAAPSRWPSAVEAAAAAAPAGGALWPVSARLTGAVTGPSQRGGVGAASDRRDETATAATLQGAGMVIAVVRHRQRTIRTRIESGAALDDENRLRLKLYFRPGRWPRRARGGPA